MAIPKEDQTLATNTFRNYFRTYESSPGAETEAVEFDNIYKLDIVVVNSDRTMQRSGSPTSSNPIASPSP